MKTKNAALQNEYEAIRQKCEALDLFEMTDIILAELGTQAPNWDRDYTGNHAGRDWKITNVKGTCTVAVDDVTVFVYRLNAQRLRCEVIEYHEWPANDWLPGFASLHKAAMRKRQQRAIHAEADEVRAFRHSFAPIGGALALVS